MHLSTDLFAGELIAKIVNAMLDAACFGKDILTELDSLASYPICKFLIRIPFRPGSEIKEFLTREYSFVKRSISDL